MRCLIIAILLLTTRAPAAEAGDIRRCLHPDGTVEMRDRACPPGTVETDRAGGTGTFSTIPGNHPPPGLLERAAQSLRRAERAGRAAGRRDRAEQSRLRCAEYEKRVAAIDRRLRKGYTASQGNRLRAERRRIRRLLGEGCR